MYRCRMLVLTRKVGEAIVIGNDVVVTVLEVRGGQIRIGIDAPRSLAVHRAEIYRQVTAENQAAVVDAVDGAEAIRGMVLRRRDANQP